MSNLKATIMDVHPVARASPLLKNGQESNINQAVMTTIDQLSDVSLTQKVGGDAALGAKVGVAVRNSKSLGVDHMRLSSAVSHGLGLMLTLQLLMAEIGQVKGELAKSPSTKDTNRLNRRLVVLMGQLRSLNRMLQKVDVLFLKLVAKIEAMMTKIIAKVTALHQAQVKKAAEKAAKVEAARKAKEAKVEEAHKAKATKAEKARKAKASAKKAVTKAPAKSPKPVKAAAPVASTSSAKPVASAKPTVKPEVKPVVKPTTAAKPVTSVGKPAVAAEPAVAPAAAGKVAPKAKASTPSDAPKVNKTAPKAKEAKAS